MYRPCKCSHHRRRTPLREPGTILENTQVVCREHDETSDVENSPIKPGRNITYGIWRMPSCQDVDGGGPTKTLRSFVHKFKFFYLGRVKVSPGRVQEK